jgi:RNA-directed DNA polymerase
MHGRGKSDGPVVPAKPPNNATLVAAEAVEERGSAEGNAGSKTRPGHRAGVSVSSELGRVRRVARKDKDVRFTALLHHVTVECRCGHSQWPHRGRLKWPHLASVVVVVDVA